MFKHLLKLLVFGMTFAEDADASLFFEEGEETTEEPEPEKKKEEDKHDYKERYKNLQEAHRQSREELKVIKQKNEALEKSVEEIKGGFKSIVGESDEAKKAKLLKEKAIEFDTDPLGYVEKLESRIDGIVDKKVEERTKSLTDARKEDMAKAIMKEIDEEYDVNWDRDHQKITKELEYFSAKAKAERPRDVLLAACRQAGAIKPKEKIPFSEISNGMYSGVPKSAIQKQKDAILKAGKKKVFKF